MKAIFNSTRRPIVAMTFALILSGGYAALALAADVKDSTRGGWLILSGAQEVPAVTTAARGGGTITIDNDMNVSGRVTTSGVQGTAAHIHEAPAGKNGPIIVSLIKSGDTYTVPEGAKLTDAQMAAFKAGNLYVNVHSAANPGGEIRAQLRP